MCVGVSVGQGQSLSEGTASSLGTPDSFPSEPRGYCADSLTATGDFISFNKIVKKFHWIWVWIIYLRLGLGSVSATSAANWSAFG